MLSCNRAVVGELHLRVMRLVARIAVAEKNTSIRLEGGTALAAYYLGHRESEDLDFFSDYVIDHSSVPLEVEELQLVTGGLIRSWENR